MRTLPPPIVAGFVACSPEAAFPGAGGMPIAGRLGRAVAEQLGRPFEEAEYRGDEPGLCLLCHLDVVVLRGRQVECATCGARGELWLDGDEVRVAFTDDGRRTSVISMEEKREHFFEIQATAERHARQRDAIERRAQGLPYAGPRIAPGRATT